VVSVEEPRLIPALVTAFVSVVADELAAGAGAVASDRPAQLAKTIAATVRERTCRP
jgi:hypothetical protein